MTTPPTEPLLPRAEAVIDLDAISANVEALRVSRWRPGADGGRQGRRVRARHRRVGGGGPPRRRAAGSASRCSRRRSGCAQQATPARSCRGWRCRASATTCGIEADVEMSAYSVGPARRHRRCSRVARSPRPRPAQARFRALARRLPAGSLASARRCRRAAPRCRPCRCHRRLVALRLLRRARPPLGEGATRRRTRTGSATRWGLAWSPCTCILPTRPRRSRSRHPGAP